MESQETHPRDGGEMTFAEIAEVLGITPGGAWMAYNSAMKKLRHPRNRQALQRLQDLADAKSTRG